MTGNLQVNGLEQHLDAGPSRLVQGVEVGVFLFLIVPSMVLSFFVTRQGSVGFPLVATLTIFRDLALVSLIVFFLWRNGEPFARIGWKATNVWMDAALGVVLFAPVMFGAGLLDDALQSIGFSAPATPEPSFLQVHGAGQIALAVVLVVVVALTEETIFRGYLMLRLGAATRSVAAAVVLSSIVFSLGHGYEGTAGVVTVGALGAVFALIYLWRGSLTAPIVIHFLQDLFGIALAPLAG
jgi:membrane protease YdiL (CAAX protease family)